MDGIIALPMPIPRTTSSAARTRYDVEALTKANGIVASVVMIKPTTTIGPPPMRSVRRPARGIAMAAPTPWGAISRPAVSAASPRSIWMYSGRMIMAPNSAPPSRNVVAAAATTFLLGGALFGAMIILPLYIQIDRGEAALTAGLLMAPQGVGAAIAMPVAGRLTDRIGGGPIVVAGLIITTLATIPFAFVSASMSYGLLAALLVVRGIGMGSAMMPSMAAAYAALKGPEVPRATSALNVIQRVGGSLGTALLAVALQHEITAALPNGAGGSAAGGSLQRLPHQGPQRLAAPLADALGNTFWWG